MSLDYTIPCPPRLQWSLLPGTDNLHRFYGEMILRFCDKTLLNACSKHNLKFRAQSTSQQRPFSIVSHTGSKAENGEAQRQHAHIIALLLFV